MLKQVDLIKSHASIFTVFHTFSSALVAVLLLISGTIVAPYVKRLSSKKNRR